MPLSIALAILLALVAAEFEPTRAWDDLSLRLLAVGVAGIMPPLVAMAAAAWTARGVLHSDGHPSSILECFDRWRDRAHLLWLVSVAALAFAAGWGAIVRDVWGLRDAVLLDELLILLPVLGPLGLLWAAAYRVEDALAQRTMRRTGRLMLLPSRARYVALHFRQQVLPVLVPVLVAATASDLLRYLPQGDEHGPLSVVLGGLFLVGLVLGYPWLLRMIWPTRALSSGPLHDRLSALASQARIRVDRILVWQTDCRIINAAVAGMVPGSRFVFLSDGLLATLEPEQVEAVFLHELGHLHHRHLLARTTAVFAPVGLAAVAYAAGLKLPDAGPLAMGAWLIPAAAVFALYLWFGLGGLARALEVQADLFACLNWAGPFPASNPKCERRAAFAGYADVMQRLQRLSGGRNRRSWQHDAMDRRLARLGEVLDSAERQKRFEQRLASVRLLLVVASLAGLATLAL